MNKGCVVHKVFSKNGKICIIAKHPIGHWLAYVETKLDLHYDEIPIWVRAHGGLTFGPSVPFIEQKKAFGLSGIKDKKFYGVDYAHIFDGDVNFSDVEKDTRILAADLWLYERFRIFGKFLRRIFND